MIKQRTYNQSEVSHAIAFWLERELGERLIGPVRRLPYDISVDVESPTEKPPPYKVHLTYFKSWNGTDGMGGKYYSEGKYESQKTAMYEIVDEVHSLRTIGALPGLVNGSRSWHILIEVPSHPHSCPHLLPWSDK